MKILIFVVGLLFAFALFYVLGGRNWLKSKSWTAGFFAAIEPVEILLFKKSETILWARLKIVSGLLLTGLTSLGAIDLTPILPLIPDQYEGWLQIGINLMPLAISLMGMVDERLRNTTTLPIEVVSLSSKDITPEVAAAVNTAEVAKVEAVAAVQEATS